METGVYNMNDRSFKYNGSACEMNTETRGPASGRDKKAAQRKQAILDAALQCFLEKGYHQTGVRDIAKCAGVSLGNLYNHFPGKHDVLVEIAALERLELEPFLKLLRSEKAAETTLERFVTDYARYLARAENVMLTIEISSEAVRKEDIGALFSANRRELVAALTQVLERGMTDGRFRNVHDAKEYAEIILDLVEGAAYRSHLGASAIRKHLKALKAFIAAALLA